MISDSTINRLYGIENFSQNFKSNTVTEEVNDGVSFEQTLGGALGKVDNLQRRADELTVEMVSGGDVELHEVMIATQEAQMALDLAVEVRNRMIDALNEFTNMQI